MGVEKVRAMVLKERPQGESGKYIWVLTQERGKMVLAARGSKKTKSKLLAGTQPFCYCDFSIYQGKGFYSVTEAELIESFFGLRQDFDCLTEGAYLLDLVEGTCMEGAEESKTLRLLLRTLWMIEKKQYPPALAARIFELKYLQMNGVAPVLDRCAVCNQPMTGNCFFDIEAGGIVCATHKRKHSNSLSSGALEAMRFVLEREEKEMFSFRISEAVEKELKVLLGGFLEEYLHILPNSREFCKKLQIGS